MVLKDYTTEQIKAELKRRLEEKRAQKEKDYNSALRCRNCKHCIEDRHGWLYCAVRTWGKNIKRNYCVKTYTKACDKFERKEE